MSTAPDPLINVRAKTQLVSEGVSRFMGEQWQMPLREGLGLVGEGEVEQWVDPTRPLVWAQNAPGPHESWQQFGDPQTQGSREGAIGGGPAGPRGGAPGDQQTRQIAGQNLSTNLQPQMYDDYRSASTAGQSGPTDQWWQRGATGSTGGATPGPISPVRPGARAGQLTTEVSGAPSQGSRQGQPPPQGRPQGQGPRGPQPISRRPMPPQRGPGLTPSRPAGREERRDDRDDRREARHERREDRYDARHEERHERREDRYDARHEERHERREDRYDRRHEASDNRQREARHERRDERGDREAHHRRRDEHGNRDRRNDQGGRRHHKG